MLGATPCWLRFTLKTNMLSKGCLLDSLNCRIKSRKLSHCACGISDAINFSQWKQDGPHTINPTSVLNVFTHCQRDPNSGICKLRAPDARTYLSNAQMVCHILQLSGDLITADHEENMSRAHHRNALSHWVLWCLFASDIVCKPVHPKDEARTHQLDVSEIFMGCAQHARGGWNGWDNH